jgi:hypothetical protein
MEIITLFIESVADPDAVAISKVYALQRISEAQRQGKDDLLQIAALS